LRETPTFFTIHSNCDALTLLKEIKGLAFNFNFNDDFKLSLTKATIKFSLFFHGKDMSNLKYQKTFDNLVEVIEQHGRSVGVHSRVLCLILEKDTGIKYNDRSVMTDYSHEQFNSAK
jgi:hypothetical protein